MQWLKFYYFSFLYYYKKKGDDWVPAFSAVLLVELTIMALFSLAALLVDPSFFTGASQSIGRFYWLLFNVIILVVLHQLLGRKVNSEKIYRKFIEHAWNTKKNRLLCWLIWITSFLAPFILVVAYKGIN